MNQDVDSAEEEGRDDIGNQAQSCIAYDDYHLTQAEREGDIEAFREELGLTQADLGQALGGSKRSVEDWEAGRRQAPAMLRLAMAAIARGAIPWSPSRALTAKATMGDVEIEIRRHLTSLASDLEVDLQYRFSDYVRMMLRRRKRCFSLRPSE